MKLSRVPGVLINDVAEALDIHPFMLSLWRRQVRDGVIMSKGAKLEVETTAERKRLRELLLEMSPALTRASLPRSSMDTG